MSGILHCSGGGQTGCRGFGRGLHYVKDSLFATPPLFQAIADIGIDGSQMYQKCSTWVIGWSYTCGRAPLPGVIEAATRFRVEAKIVGQIEQE